MPLASEEAVEAYTIAAALGMCANVSPRRNLRKLEADPCRHILHRICSLYRNDALFFSCRRISCTTFSSASEIESASAR